MGIRTPLTVALDTLPIIFDFYDFYDMERCPELSGLIFPSMVETKI